MKPSRRTLNRRCTIHHVAQTDDVDEYGNPASEEQRPTKTRCYLEPWMASRMASREDETDRSTTIDEWRWIVKAGTPVESIDHVDIHGEPGTFELVGEPARAWDPSRRRVSHIEAKVRRTRR